MKRTQRDKIDIALSYASEDHAHAEALVKALKERKVQYFFDVEEKHTLWGKNLYPYLSDLYQNKARYCVVFISKHYATTRWKSHELAAAQARAFQENEEYILPIRLDETQLPGILPTTGYLDWPPETAETVADILLKKLGREPYQPPQLSVSEAVLSITSQQTAPTAVQGRGGQRSESAEDAVLQAYIEKIEEKFQAGNATELTYRAPLEELLKKFVPEITVTHEPRRETYGTPDYMISQKTSHGLLTIGYMEAKDVNANLDDIEHDAAHTEPKTHDGKQLKKYQGALTNLVLTNYLEFRWFINGERRMTARLISPVIDKGLPAKKGAKRNAQPAFDQLMLGIHAQNTMDVARLLAGFLTYSTEPISNPKELAERMARITRIIRDMAIVAFEQNELPDSLSDLYRAFKEVLLPDLTPAQFADMFAQTLAYGLFAARYNHRGSTPFQRQDAAREIPNTNPFLADLFEKITGRSLEEVPFIGFVDDLAQLLAQTDMNAVLANFGKRTRREDPLIHFYETFLTQYDPKLRELRGVYYTPEPVISYIVRSVDSILRNHFDCPQGLADTSKVTYTRLDEHGNKEEKTSHRVLLLDPACGTGTFPYAIINHIRETYRQTENAGMWSSYVREHLLPRIFGFELLMAPYAMAHLKLGMQLAALDLPESEQNSWSYDFKSKERLGIYLTNSLEQAMQRSEILFARYISDEANIAAKVKQEYPVMVILGNPPYSGHSANKGPWIIDLLHGIDPLNKKKVANYFEVDGQPLGERNPKWLNDDYVKFIRFAHWRIERTGYGVLAFVTNHGYLDNPTFRGMRQSLMQSFDDIYILNLHGNSKKKERSPDSSKDENVFDIQQGVAISIFVKRLQKSGSSNVATVHHAHLWGQREVYEKVGKTQRLMGGKYYWLADHDITTTDWTILQPTQPFYWFAPQNVDLWAEYEAGMKLTEIMSVNVLGFQTHRDHFAIDLDRDALYRRIREMRDNSISDQEYAEKYNLHNASAWQLAKARQKIRSESDWQSFFIQFMYRPFDRRFCYFHDAVVDRPRPELQKHMLRPNLSLNVTRQTKAGLWGHALVADSPTPALYTEIKDGSNAFPLYLYPNIRENTLFDTEDIAVQENSQTSNFSATFIADISSKLRMNFVNIGQGDLNKTFGPEDVFDYIYAIFYSLSYRQRYTEFLKTDFPRLPLTSKIDLFRSLCLFGQKLVELHLLKASSSVIPSYPVKGNNKVDIVRYTESVQGAAEKGRVWINSVQYFEGISTEIWEFYIGGYQVCQKWLKDRKDRILSYEDIMHYQQIVGALGQTIALMEQIDEAIEEHGGWPIV